MAIFKSTFFIKEGKSDICQVLTDDTAPVMVLPVVPAIVAPVVVPCPKPVPTIFKLLNVFIVFDGDWK